MAPKITEEMRVALAASPGQPLRVEDDETRQIYLLVDATQGQALMHEWIRRELKVGLDAVEAGQVGPFDPQAIKAAGRRPQDPAL